MRQSKLKVLHYNIEPFNVAVFDSAWNDGAHACAARATHDLWALIALLKGTEHMRLVTVPCRPAIKRSSSTDPREVCYKDASIRRDRCATLTACQTERSFCPRWMELEGAGLTSNHTKSDLSSMCSGK